MALNRLSYNCFDLGAECDGVVTIVLLPTSPQSGSAALIERISIRVRAVALYKGESFEQTHPERDSLQNDALKKL